MFVTSEGRPGARLQRALAAANLTAAEQAAFELPIIPLAEARALVESYAEKGDRKYERAALKYLRRYMDEADPSPVPVRVSPEVGVPVRSLETPLSGRFAFGGQKTLVTTAVKLS